MKKKLVLGIGNSFRCDDSVGSRAVDLLLESYSTLADFEKQSGEGTSLMQAWGRYKTVVVIDAVRSGASPGTLYRFDAQQDFFEPDFFHYSSHAFGVAEAIEMARALGTLPERLLVLGVEGRRFETGVDLSPEVEAALPQLVEEVRGVLQEEERIS